MHKLLVTTQSLTFTWTQTSRSQNDPFSTSRRSWKPDSLNTQVPGPRLGPRAQMGISGFEPASWVEHREALKKGQAGFSRAASSISGILVAEKPPWSLWNFTWHLHPADQNFIHISLLLLSSDIPAVSPLLWAHHHFPLKAPGSLSRWRADSWGNTDYLPLRPSSAPIFTCVCHLDSEYPAGLMGHPPPELLFGEKSFLITTDPFHSTHLGASAHIHAALALPLPAV